MFTRDTYTDENGETIHVVSQADGVDEEAGEGDLLIGQFGAYKSGWLEEEGPHTAMYEIGLEEVEECLIKCTQERHR